MRWFRSNKSDPPPFESPWGTIIRCRPILRVVRIGLLTSVAVIALIDLAGEPLLRWNYRYRGKYSDPVITDATYVGVSGPVEVVAHEHAEGCPLILFLKPEPPLWRQIAHRASVLIFE